MNQSWLLQNYDYCKIMIVSAIPLFSSYKIFNTITNVIKATMTTITGTITKYLIQP